MRARTLAPLQVSICCIIVDVKSSKSQRKMMPTHILMFSLNHSTFNVSHVRIIKRQQWNRTKQSKLGNWIEQTHISPPLFAVQSVVCSLLCTTQCKFYVCIECARSYACVCVHEYTRALRLIRTHANGARPQLMSASAYFIFQHINIMKCVVSRQPIVESTGWMCAFSQTKKKCSRFSFHHKIHRRFCVCVCSTEAAPAPTSSLPLALCLCASEVYVWVFEIVCFFFARSLVCHFDYCRNTPHCAGVYKRDETACACLCVHDRCVSVTCTELHSCMACGEQYFNRLCWQHIEYTIAFHRK